MKRIDRRSLLRTGGTLAAATALPGARSLATPSSSSRHSGQAPYGEDGVEIAWPSFPSADPELVRALVAAAHSDVDRVAELVTARPALSRAAVDWGFGDWESALGAAAHMGRRDIAEVLIAHGARPNLFSAAMMGQLDVVRGFVAAQPGIQRIPGPHGIGLLAHARAGGAPAAAVHEYLESLGDADPRGPRTIEMSAAQRAGFVGVYAYGDSSTAAVEVTASREALSVKRAGQEFGRRMFPVSESEFYPSGAWQVRIAFDLDGGVATALRVIDGGVVLTARRQG